MGEMLSVKNINVFYGSIQALRNISFHVDEGEIVTMKLVSSKLPNGNTRKTLVLV